MKYKLVNKEITDNYTINVLQERGITNVDAFLHPTESNLQSWRGLDNIDLAQELIKQTIYDEKPYALVADCDVDGATSSAILYQYLKNLNPNKEIIYYIHSGKQHGLEDMWETLMDKEYSAILVPDAGSNDSEYAKKLNAPILVLDHHIIENEITAQNMIVVNNQSSKYYKNKNLCGAGVVWQFCRSLDEYFQRDYARRYIDLAALGIVADMMSMLEYENQYIVKAGFQNVSNFFFTKLIEKQSFSMGGKVNPMTVAFYVVPLINAVIRVGSQEEKERLYRAFIHGDEKVVSHKRGANGALEYLAVECARECTNAKSHQDKEKESIVSRLETKIFKYDLLSNKILLIRLDDDDVFPSELNGLVAMQLCARYHRPTIVGRLNAEGYIRGSARGVNQSELTSFKNYLNSTGYFEYTLG